MKDMSKSVKFTLLGLLIGAMVCTLIYCACGMAEPYQPTSSLFAIAMSMFVQIGIFAAALVAVMMNKKFWMALFFVLYYAYFFVNNILNVFSPFAYFNKAYGGYLIAISVFQFLSMGAIIALGVGFLLFLYGKINRFIVDILVYVALGAMGACLLTNIVGAALDEVPWYLPFDSIGVVLVLLVFFFTYPLAYIKRNRQEERTDYGTPTAYQPPRASTVEEEFPAEGDAEGSEPPEVD